ncbi:hypothetical protein AB4Z54_54050, partial [Streptomyces sp. MCAF7]
FILDDLVLMLMANKGIQTASPTTQVAASRRFAGFVIQALTNGPHNAPLPPPARLASTGVDKDERISASRKGRG